MSCTCLIEVDDGDYVEMISKRHFFAKKPHACGECGREIAPGEVYLHEVYKYEGLFEAHKTCVDCESIRNNLTCGFTFGWVLQDLSDSIASQNGVSEECLARLTPTARATLCGFIEDNWDDDDEEGER